MEIATRRREQEVWQACDDLWSQHGELRNLTGDLIRERLVYLGKSRGSPNEIYKYRKTWMMSRGINPSVLQSNDESDDPISRAVRLVHEQLKAEANAQIVALEENFNAELLQKDQLLSETKKALDKVMAEFAFVTQECSQKTAQIRSLDEQLNVEIDLRKACEKELVLNKSLLEKEKLAHGVLVNEIKEIYKNEMAQAKSREHELVLVMDAKINTLIEEKRILGYEYSEKLNEIKTFLYNQEIINKNAEQKMRVLLQEIKSLNEALQEKNKKIEELFHDNAAFSSALVHNKAELERIKAEKKSFEILLKSCATERKKSDLTVARLRTILHHKH